MLQELECEWEVEWEYGMRSVLELRITAIICIHLTWKNFNNDSNQKISRIFPFDFGNFTSFLPLCIAFSPITTATSCQDADFFPGLA